MFEKTNKKKSIKTKILWAFLLVSLVSLIVSSAVMLISMIHIRALTLESGNNIGSTAAKHGREYLREQTFLDVAKLVRAESDTIDLRLKDSADTVALLKGYIERIYGNKEEFRPLRIPNYRDVPPGQVRLHWFLDYGVVSNPRYNEEDLLSAGLLDELYLLGNLERIVELAMEKCPNISTIYFALNSGLNIQYDGDTVRKAQYIEHTAWIARERLWYISARDRKGLYISDAYNDPAGRGLCLSMAMPFYGKAGEFMGVVGIDIRIEDLDKNIRETVVRQSGYAFLINNNAGNEQHESKIISAPGLNEQNENDMAAFLGDNAAEILADMRALSDGHGYFALGEEGEERRVYVIWSPIKLTNWQLAYVVSEEDILASATALYDEITGITMITVGRVDRFIRMVILVSGFLMFLIVFLTVWAARVIAGRIARPITALTGNVKKIGNGNLDYFSEIKTGDEIEELSLSFEHMTVELKGYIENLRLITAEKERIGAELNVATKIQASMLPRIFPPFPNRKEFDLYGSMLPAKEVGGDFYDFFLIDEDTLVVLIADVSGKGVPAALFMVIAKTLIKNDAQYGLSPREVFERVNNLLCNDNEASMFVTVFMGYLDIPSGKFTCVNAGHNPPLLKRGNSFEWFKTKHGLVLGAIEGVSYKEEEILLLPDDMIYFYTDGVTEAMNPEEQLFGEDRLMEAALAYRERDVQEFAHSIKRDIDAFAAGAEQADDITMLVLQYYGNVRGKEIKAAARPENLDAVLDFVNAELAQTGCSSKIQNQINIAVEEIFMNIAYYAYSPETGTIIVRFGVSGNVIRLEFEDSGKPFNPLQKPDPDITARIEDRSIGGLGIFMVKKTMDSVEYRRCNGDKNLLILKKTILSGF
jgi:sigma-B regulation protein RsbU (phosphoserine phosphatase)